MGERCESFRDKVIVIGVYRKLTMFVGERSRVFGRGYDRKVED